MSFRRDTRRLQRPCCPAADRRDAVGKRLRTFFDWTFAGVLERAWALRLSVISLGIAVTFLPSLSSALAARRSCCSRLPSS